MPMITHIDFEMIRKLLYGQRCLSNSPSLLLRPPPRSKGAPMRHHHTPGRAQEARPASRWAGAAALGAAVAMTLAACGGGNAAKGTGTNTGGSTAKANGPVQVALILKDFTNPYFISMENSAKADAAKLGVK